MSHMRKTELCKFYYWEFSGSRTGCQWRYSEDCRACHSINELVRLRGNENRGMHYRIVWEDFEPSDRDRWVQDRVGCHACPPTQRKTWPKLFET